MRVRNIFVFQYSKRINHTRISKKLLRSLSVLLLLDSVLVDTVIIDAVRLVIDLGDLSLLGVGFGDVRMSISDVGVLSGSFLKGGFGEIVSGGVSFDSEEREEDDPCSDDLIIDPVSTKSKQNKDEKIEMGVDGWGLTPMRIVETRP